MTAPPDIVYCHHAFFQHISSRAQPPAEPRRHSASRQKLAGFSEKHLVELSEDMHEELQRRLHPERFPSGPLAPRNDIHWKRNDARKHVGSLPTQRFDDICRDLLQEQERRYPELKSMPISADESPPVRNERRDISGSSMTSAKSAGSTQSADAYAFPLSASPRENGEGADMFESANPVPHGQSPDLQSPDLQIQSVAESKIEPKKTQIIESDDESDSDDDDGGGHGVYNIYGSTGQEHEPFRELDSKELSSRDLKEYKDEDVNTDVDEDPDSTAKAHLRNSSEVSGRTSYLTTEDMPTQASTQGLRDLEDHDRPFTTSRSISDRQPTRESGSGYYVHPDVEMLSSRIRDLENENEQHRNHIERLQVNQRDLDLENTLEEQRAITEKVRQKAVNFLEEMRALTQQHERQVYRADSMDAEAKHWKNRYNKLQVELDMARKQRVNAAIEQPQLTELPAEWVSPSGLVSEQQLRHYFGAISALVACVHSDKGKRSDALETLHAVVLASRALTQDKRSLIAKAANLLITVVRNFAVSKGLMPLIIVDSACSDLTMAVIDYCSKQKVRVTGSGPQAEAESGSKSIEVFKKPDQPKTHKKTKSSVSFQFDESKRSRELPKTPTPPPQDKEKDKVKTEPITEEPRLEAPIEPRMAAQPVDPGQSEDAGIAASSSTASGSDRTVRASKFRPVQGPHLPPDSSIQSLQTYLEEQTSGTVDAIGALLAGIKNNVVAGELKPRVGEIKELVGEMIDASNSAIAETRNRLLKERGTLIVDNLKNCLARMDMLLIEELEAIRDDAKPNRHLKQRLAGVSFDMAKSTKELVKTVEEATLKDELEGIDRQLH